MWRSDRRHRYDTGRARPAEEGPRRAGSASRREAARSGVSWDPGLPRPDAVTGYRTRPEAARGLGQLPVAPQGGGGGEVVGGVEEMRCPGRRLLTLRAVR